MAQRGTLEDLVAQVMSAKSATDVLGPLDDGRKQRERELAKRLHPDAGGDQDAFARLQELISVESRRMRGSFTITTKTRPYNVEGLAYQGRVANLYRATSPGVTNTYGSRALLVKLPRSPKDSDLIQADASALRRINDSGKKRRGYYPEFIEGFKHRDIETRIDRRAFVMEHLEGFYSLAQVKAAYPGGIDARDLAWMWRRLLAGISLTHELGLVHGSLVPEHILIHPSEHGVIICDFTASVEDGGTISYLGGDAQFFPPEVLDKKPVDASTDIYTLSKTMAWMLRADAPRQFTAFVQGCTTTRMKTRPHDARQLMHEYDSLLERLYGKRKFRVFNMPTTSEGATRNG